MPSFIFRSALNPGPPLLPLPVTANCSDRGILCEVAIVEGKWVCGSAQPSRARAGECGLRRTEPLVARTIIGADDLLSGMTTAGLRSSPRSFHVPSTFPFPCPCWCTVPRRPSYVQLICCMNGKNFMYATTATNTHSLIDSQSPDYIFTIFCRMH